MKKFFAVLAVLITTIVGGAAMSAPAQAFDRIITPSYASVYWDPAPSCDIHATRPSDTAYVTYTEEDGVVFPDGTVRWVVTATLNDHGDYFVNPLPSGYTLAGNTFTAEVSYLDTYCG